MNAGELRLLYRHTLLVRITHWINALSFLFMIPSGIAVLIAHPEFYWGETGYFGERALLTLPIEPNFDHTGWGRGMHFFFAWVLVINGLIYILCGLLNGHFRRRFLPSAEQLQPRHILHEMREHARLRARRGKVAQHYNVLQKLAYLVVVFLLLPVMVLTGLAMSPALTAAFPELLAAFGGRQSARTVHFIVASLLVVFVFGHLLQVFLAGFGSEMRAMVNGRFPIDREHS